jgi:serine/threonine-protein kinase ULK4
MQNYQIYEEIGKGRYSTVYKGRRKQTAEYYAVKSIEKAQRARVLNEVQILHALQHPNVLRFHHWYETSNHLWLILEYCSGSTLRAIMDADGAMPDSTIRSFGGDILEGLSFVHSRGILYHEFFPSRLLVDGTGIVKLSDFGGALPVPQSDDPQANAVRPGERDVLYTSPELLEPVGGVPSYASDLWAVGCIMFELATGRRPFDGPDAGDVLAAVKGGPPPLHQATPSFRDLVSGLLTPDPWQRLRWKEILAHPYWEGSRRPGQGICPDMPPQPLWERSVQPRPTRIPRHHRGSPDTPTEGAPRRISVESVAAASSLGPPDDVIGPVQTPTSSRLGVDPATRRLCDSAESLTIGSASGATPPRPLSEAKSEDTLPASLPLEDPRPWAPILAAVEKLLLQPSDLHVRPIISNPRIEKTAEPNYVAADLTFPGHPLEAIQSMSPSDLEGFLTQVYRAIGGSSKAAAKSNCLSYLQTLCGDADLVGILINSSLAKLLVKMLLNASHPSSLRAQVCLVLGLMVRHTSVIHPDFSIGGLTEALLSVLAVPPSKEARKLRRRAVACLGELLFYTAHQPKAEGNADQVPHEVDGPVLTALTDVLLGDDEVAQHYAAKTIENIAVEGDRAFTRELTPPAVLRALVTIYLSGTKNEHLRTTAISCLARVCRAVPDRLAFLADELGPAGLLRLSDANRDRTNQAAVVLLVMQLAQCLPRRTASPSSPSSSSAQPFHAPHLSVAPLLSLFSVCYIGPAGIQKLETDLQKDGGSFFVSRVCSMLEHGSNALRAKCILAVLIVALGESRYLLLFCEANLCHTLQSFLQEKDKYLAACIQALLRAFTVLTASALSGLAAALEALPPDGSAPPEDEPLMLALHVLAEPSVRTAVLSAKAVAGIARCLAAVDGLPAADQPPFKGKLFAIVETLLQDPESLRPHAAAVIGWLLPALIGLLRSPDGDTRFFCLKVIIEALSFFVSGPDLFQVGGPHEETRRLTAAMTSIVPLCGSLLDDDDPIPLYTLKLMSLMTTADPSLVGTLHAHRLLPRVAEFFDVDHRNNNVHNVRLVLKFLEADVIPKLVAFQLGIPTRLAAVLRFAVHRVVEPFFEPCLAITRALLTAAAQGLPGVYPDDASPVAQELPLFLLLCTSADPAISELAAECVALAVRVGPPAARGSLFLPKSLVQLREVVRSGASQRTVGCVLEALVAVLSGPDRRPLRDPTLREAIETLARGPPSEVADAARHALALFA